MSDIDRRLDTTLHALGHAGSDVFVLSLGAGDGVTGDNTYGYIDLYGWGGLFVESAPELFARLEARYRHRPNVQLERAVIAAENGEVERPAGGQIVRVPALRLNTLLANHAVSRVDVLDIDAAGREWMVLEQFDFERFQPTVVRLAWSHVPLGERVLAVRRLRRHGYSVDAFYDELVALRPPPERASAAPETNTALLGRPVPRQDSQGDIVLYAITYNAPGQLELWLASVEAAAPELLRLPRKFLLDNSTRPDTREAYDRLAARYGFEILRHGNLGISGGRQHCARHFHDLTGAWAMLWFEDDMLFAPPGPGLCRNGLPTHVPRLLDRARGIVVKEDLDFLKLSFTEFFGDHHLNWAWYNVPEETRRREFPDGTYRTRIDHTGAEDGVSYVVGEVHYSNWPTLMTRRGNQQLFLSRQTPQHEQLYMADAFMLMREGRMRAGALLASPIAHCRTFHYPAQDRREF